MKEGYLFDYKSNQFIIANIVYSFPEPTIDPVEHDHDYASTKNPKVSPTTEPTAINDENQSFPSKLLLAWTKCDKY